MVIRRGEKTCIIIVQKKSFVKTGSISIKKNSHVNMELSLMTFEKTKYNIIMTKLYVPW